jgi:hypothetical protein
MIHRKHSRLCRNHVLVAGNKDLFVWTSSPWAKPPIAVEVALDQPGRGSPFTPITNPPPAAWLAFVAFMGYELVRRSTFSCVQRPGPSDCFAAASARESVFDGTIIAAELL